jgi:hypothetical protein
MKLLNKQSRFIKPGLIFLFITLIVLGIYSCNKKETLEAECAKCNQNKQTKDVVVNKKTYKAIYSASSSQGFIVTAISQNEMPQITNGLFTVFSEIGIEVPASIATYEPYGLALFYDEAIGGDIHGYNPISFLVYYKNIENQRTYAGFWNKDIQTNEYIFIPNLSGMNNMISSTNFEQLNKIINEPNGIELKEVFVLCDETKLPTSLYRTIFQVKLENANTDPIGSERPNGSEGGPNCMGCKSKANGYCIDLYTCVPDICLVKSSMEILTAENYPLSQEDIDYLYWIRDSVLMNSEKGQQIIDDYYYSGQIMKGNISFSLAMKLYKLYGIDLFKHFPEFFMATTYDGDVLIDDKVREIVIEMCDEAKDLSNDARFQSIIKNTKADIDKYYNRPFIEIRNDY